jgi:hypothetical protein
MSKIPDPSLSLRCVVVFEVAPPRQAQLGGSGGGSCGRGKGEAELGPEDGVDAEDEDAEAEVAEE